MKKLKQLSILALLACTVLTSCGGGEDSPTTQEPTLNVEDFSATVDENQLNGAELGSLKVTTNQSDVTYTLKSQTPAGAIAVSEAGKVTVANGTAFNFQTNPTITGAVEVKAGALTKNINITITLNNVDETILSSLSDSQQKYIDAADGDWIQITEAEYENLFTNLKQTTKIGFNQYPTNRNYLSDGYGSIRPNWTCVNAGANWTKIPANSYVIAFKYSPKRDYLHSKTKVKTNLNPNDISNGYNDLGGVLPAHNTKGNSNACFVIKGNNTKNQNGGILAFYCDGFPGAHVNNSAVGGMRYGNGNTSRLLDSASYSVVYQGISTTSKQW